MNIKSRQQPPELETLRRVPRHNHQCSQSCLSYQYQIGRKGTSAQTGLLQAPPASAPDGATGNGTANTLSTDIRLPLLLPEAVCQVCSPQATPGNTSETTPKWGKYGAPHPVTAMAGAHCTDPFWPGLTAQIPSPAPRTAQLPPFVLTQYKAPLSEANTPRHLSASQQTGHLKGYLKGSQAPDKFPQRGSPQNTQPILLVTVKVIKSKENLRNHQIQEELNEI